VTQHRQYRDHPEDIRIRTEELGDEHHDGTLEHVEQEGGGTELLGELGIAGFEDAEDVGGTDVATALFFDVDTAELFGQEIPEGDTGDEVGSDIEVEILHTIILLLLVIFVVRPSSPILWQSRIASDPLGWALLCRMGLKGHKNRIYGKQFYQDNVNSV